MLKLSRRELIRDVSKATGNKLSDVESIFDSMEEIVEKYLRYAKDNKDSIEIKIFNGLSIFGKYKGKEVKMNYIVGENRTVYDRLIINSKVSRRYREKINKKK